MPIHRLLLPQLKRPSGAWSNRRRSGLVRTGDQGFALVETIVAMGVFAIVAMFTVGSLSAGLQGVLLGKRRQVATQEANRTLEIARSLSYNDVGLVQPPTDPTITSDTAIQIVSGVLSFSVDGSWEPIIWATNPTGHPFSPHTINVARGSTSLTRYVYVSGLDASGDGATDTKRVTVRVVWDTGGGPAKEVRAQTLINESGTTPTGPGGGGLTPLTAKSFASGGSLSIEGALLGLPVPLNLTLPTSTGTSTFRAVSNTNCSTKSAALQATDLVDLEGYSVGVTADDDTRTNTPSSPPPESSTGLLTIPAGPVSTLLGSTIGSPVSCDASVDPYGHQLGTASALSALNAQRNIVGLGGLLNWLVTLASVQTLPVSQEIEHEIVGGQREAHTSASAGTGLVNVLKIPGLIGDGLVRVDALTYAASVRGAEGTPSVAPAVTSPTINLRVFDNGNKLPNGSVCQSHSGGYCLISVDPAAVGFPGLSASVTHNFTQLLGLNLINISYTTHVDILPPTRSPTSGVVGPNGERRWSAEYSPIAVAAELHASVLGISLIDATVDLNLGSVKAEACAGTTC